MQEYNLCFLYDEPKLMHYRKKISLDVANERER